MYDVTILKNDAPKTVTKILAREVTGMTLTEMTTKSLVPTPVILRKAKINTRRSTSASRFFDQHSLTDAMAFGSGATNKLIKNDLRRYDSRGKNTVSFSPVSLRSKF
jgi:hypothetical protein